MHHFKYNGENIFDDAIENGDWILMSLGSNYYFNRAEFQQWCEEEHSEFLENYADIDEDGKFIHWEDIDLDMELAWLVEAVVTGKVKHYKHTYE